MRGLMWTVGVWAATWLVLAIVARLRKSRFDVRPRYTEIATACALLATHSFASAASAEDVIANPLAIERVMRGGLAALAIVIVLPALLNRRQERLFSIGRGMIALTLYLGTAVISTTYSVAPAVTLGKAFELGSAVAILWAVATESDPLGESKRLLRAVLLLQGSLVVAAVAGFVLNPVNFSVIQNRPGFLTPATMVSPFMHSNSLSAWSAIISAYCLAKSFEVGTSLKGWWRAGFAVGAIGVGLASGRQGLIMWLAAILVVMVVHRSTASILVFAPIAAFVVSLYWEPIWSAIGRDQAAHTLTTLSGRTIWWASAIESWAAHPWLGYGFGAGGRFVALDALGDSNVSSVHSGYLEALMGVGVFGVVFLLFAIWRMVGWSAMNIRVHAADSILAVPLLLHTFVSLGFGAWLQAGFFLFGLLVLRSDLTIQERGTMREPISTQRGDHSIQESDVLVPGGLGTLAPTR